jgi:DNA modification methylase
MASGEMTSAEFLAFNGAWMASVLPYLCDGGILGTFIDWRGSPTVHSAATKLGLVPLNLIVWAKTNAGMGSLYRSQHELLPLFKKGLAHQVVRANRRDFLVRRIARHFQGLRPQSSVRQLYFTAEALDRFLLPADKDRVATTT